MKELIMQNSANVAFVDDEDFTRLSAFKWHWGERGIFRSYWLKGGGKSVTVMLSCEVMQNHPQCYDHKNRIWHDNQKENLRPCTYSQNNMNRAKVYGSSKYKGVSWFKDTSKWKAQIRVDGRLFYLGLFLSEEDAAKVYDKAASEKFGEFAVLNFPK